MILVNGNVITMTAADATVAEHRGQALAIHDARILAVGDESAVRAAVSVGAQVVDLEGKTVLPGFIDSHMHCFVTGISLVSARLETAASVAEVCERMAEQAGRTPAGSWVYGTGCVPWALAEGRYPTMEELARAVPDHPAYIAAVTFHSGSTNTRGFELIGLQPGRHGVEVDAEGRPTGAFLSDDSHFAAAGVAFGSLSDDEIAALYRKTASFAASRGVTTLHCLDGQFIEGDRDVRVLLDAADQLDAHTVVMYQTMDVQKALNLGLPRIGGCLTIDGAGFERTALMYEPYADDSSTCGDQYITEDEILSFVREAHGAGLQIGMHAIGDKAVDLLVSAYDQALEEYPRDDARHRVEHFYLPSPRAVELAERHGLALPMQPVFSYMWDQDDSAYERLWGPVRAARAEPFSELCARGLVVSGGSDSPVTEVNPLVGIHGAVNNPRASRRVSVEDAIRMFTINGAWVAFEEEEKGTIEAGKLADLVVLDRDPFLEPESIADFRVEMTIMGGRVVYSAEEGPA
ncbi:MAG: amidohydrolase [Thermoleophilia bacterium]|nr:amidohydrolase [Thermoleophilia bacterium]